LRRTENPKARSLWVVIVAIAGGLFAAGCATRPAFDRDHEMLVAAERAFARHAEDADVRTAFLTAFADDGIWMTPTPMRLREAYAARPAPADPGAIRLEWAPVISGISASGDFGFTSGPSTLSLRDGSRPPRHGAYFSVWKRDTEQRWRVVLDAGITSASPIAPEALLPSPAVRPNPVYEREAGIVALTDAERARPWGVDAFVDTLSDDARLYNEGPPLFGTGAIRTSVAAMHPLTLEPAGGDIATSGDLAYTYGAWRSANASGHYVHLWTRSARGTWRIAVALRL
jgi:ketosteroid isomerase-like protein